MASSAYNTTSSANLNKSPILLVGRDGNGKTSCKTSIERVSNDIEVVDFSGLGDTGFDRLYDIEIVRNNIRLIMETCDKRGGFKAVIFVMKYGVRFTKQEKDAVDDVKAMLGEDVFRKHGIILMSYGDMFDSDNADDGRDFMTWCQEQTGEIKNLFRDVNYRIVLLNNRTKHMGSLQKQCHELRSLVIGLGNPYGLLEFRNAQELQQRPIGIIPSNTNLNTSRSSCISNHAYKILWLCLLLNIVFGISFIIGVVKVILALAIPSGFCLLVFTGVIIALQSYNRIPFA